MRHMCVRCARQACARRPCVAWPLPVSRARRHARPPWRGSAYAPPVPAPADAACSIASGRMHWGYCCQSFVPSLRPSVHPSPGPPECESIARPDRRRRGHPAPCLPHCFVPAFCPQIIWHLVTSRRPGTAHWAWTHGKVTDPSSNVSPCHAVRYYRHAHTTRRASDTDDACVLHGHGCFLLHPWPTMAHGHGWLLEVSTRA